MKKVLVFAGSSSKVSINKKLAEYAASQLKNTAFEVLDLNDYPLPLFSVDLEKENGFPENALSFNNQIAGSRGIILSLAEHNGSYSAVFKNLFDWLSRIDGKVWKNKPMLLLSASPGGRGGKGVLQAALARFPFHNGKIVEHFSIPHFNDNFKEDKVVHKALNEQLGAVVSKFEASL